MALSDERRAARIYLLRHAAAWLWELDETDLLDGADRNIDPIKLKEARALSHRLDAMAAKLEAAGN